MGKVYRLDDDASKQELIERFTPPEMIGEPWEKSYQWVVEKINDARERGLFDTTVDFRSIRSPLMVTEVAVAPRLSMADYDHVRYRVFPQSGVNPEWIVSTLVCRSEIIVMEDRIHSIFQHLLGNDNGCRGLPTNHHVIKALIVASMFPSFDDFVDTLRSIIQRNNPKIRARATILEASKEFVRPLVNGSVDRPTELARFFEDANITNDAQSLSKVFDGGLRLTGMIARNVGKSHWAYMTFPRSVYTYNIPVDVADFDVILDPTQVW